MASGGTVFFGQKKKKKKGQLAESISGFLKCGRNPRPLQSASGHYNSSAGKNKF
jgi:hypothetical protein